MKVFAQYFTNRILHKSKEVENFLLIKISKIETDNKYELEEIYKELAGKHNDFWGKLKFLRITPKDVEKMYEWGGLSISESSRIVSCENKGSLKVLIETEKLSKIREIIKVCKTTESREIFLDEEAVKLVFSLGI